MTGGILILKSKSVGMKYTNILCNIIKHGYYHQRVKIITNARNKKVGSGHTFFEGDGTEMEDVFKNSSEAMLETPAADTCKRSRRGRLPHAP